MMVQWAALIEMSFRLDHNLDITSEVEGQLIPGTGCVQEAPNTLLPRAVNPELLAGAKIT